MQIIRRKMEKDVCTTLADIKSPAERHKNMAAIHGKDTKPEIFIRRLLFARGYRYRTHPSSLPGHPDIWMKKYNTAIFINGCFWHRHKDCKFAYLPKTRTDFWEEKFCKNIERDIKVQNELKGLKVRCLVIWECTTKKMQRDPDYLESVASEIELFLHSDNLSSEL